MRKKRWIIAAIVAAAVVLVLGTMALPGLLSTGQPARAGSMNIETVARLKGADRQLISGSVQTAESENFYVDATKGRVSDIKVAQGSPVRQGDELYVYSNPTLTIQAEKARIQLRTVKRQVSSLETKHANIQRDIRKAANDQILEQLKAERDQIREELEAARTQVRLAELDIEETDDQVAALTVRSNFDGVVETVNEDERNAVAQGSATAPLIRVVSNLPYEVRGSLSELQRAQVKQDQAFVATSKALPGQEWRGTISYVSTFPLEAASTQGQDYSAQAQYEFIAGLASQENLVPGNTLFLEINTTGDESVRLPAEAVLRDEEGGSAVFLVENNRLRRQPVTVEAEVDGQVAVTSPLDDRAEILLNPDPGMTEGMEVVR